jgi:UDP-N-acetylmuramoyl-L-alanyl-D-glutamate--2,6-diaminopimelate ligase
MKKVEDLLHNIKVKNKLHLDNISIDKITFNSKESTPNSLFVAIKGEKYDGHDFIEEAISKGAKVVICQKDVDVPIDATKIIVDDTPKTLALLSRNFYDVNFDKIKIIGITGTNGKTTTLFLIDRILKEAGFKTASVGTLGARIKQGQFKKLGKTTPPSLKLYSLIDQMLKENIDYCIMEVSSHGLCQERTYGIDFNQVIFTNLSWEHLDYHKDMESYFNAKCKLFTNSYRKQTAIINKDDSFYSRLKSVLNLRHLTYAIEEEADFKAKQISFNKSSTRFIIKTPKNDMSIKTHLVGAYNIYNILAAFASCYNLGVEPEVIKKAIESVSFIPGRFQQVDEGQSYRVFIDYAHSQAALENVLKALKSLCGKDDHLITVFGCGGDRDKGKRSEMAKVAERYSDYVIVTTDNPRSEDPEDIARQVMNGFAKQQNHQLVLDRKEAIKKALLKAKKNDILLIAGKGHEAKQIFKDKIIDFDDVKITRNLIKTIKK